MASRLIEKADSEVTAKGFQRPMSAMLEEQVARLRNAVPIENARSLSDIVNCGWTALDDSEFWAQLDHIPDRNKTLKELIIKSMEVFEIEQIRKDMVPSNDDIKG